MAKQDSKNKGGKVTFRAFDLRPGDYECRPALPSWGKPFVPLWGAVTVLAFIGAAVMFLIEHYQSEKLVGLDAQITELSQQIAQQTQALTKFRGMEDNVNKVLDWLEIAPPYTLVAAAVAEPFSGSETIFLRQIEIKATPGSNQFAVQIISSGAASAVSNAILEVNSRLRGLGFDQVSARDDSTQTGLRTFEAVYRYRRSQ